MSANLALQPYRPRRRCFLFHTRRNSVGAWKGPKRPPALAVPVRHVCVRL